MADYRTQTTLPRGIRNNNPGNIKVGESWQGAVGSDGTFIIFSDTTWGLRAVGKAVTNMINKGLDTIDKLIRSWSATDQDAYVANVSALVGISPGDQLGTDPDTIGGIIRGICNQESGASVSAQYISDQDIAQAIAMINSPVSTFVQAAAVDATSQPIPYVVGALLVGLAVWLFTRRR